MQDDYALWPNSSQLRRVFSSGPSIARTLNTDLEGNAVFNNLEPGEYVLFGIPDTRYYAPGYYTSSGFAAKK